MNKRIVTYGIMSLAMTTVALGGVWDQLATYEYGDEANPAEAISKMLQGRPVTSYGQIEEGLIGVVTSAQATATVS